MPSIDKVNLELSVVLGSTRMPIHQLLRMGRGAVIELDPGEEGAVVVLANDHPIAHGMVFVDGERIGVEITSMIVKNEREDSDGGPVVQAA